jgi:hypothetical protein
MPTHQQYVDSIKESAVSMGKKSLVAYLTKKAPFLFVPVIGPVVSLILGKVVEILVRETEYAIFFQYIDMRVDSQGRAFSEAARKNAEAQRSGTPEQKASAEKELIEKFRALVILRN